LKLLVGEWMVADEDLTLQEAIGKLLTEKGRTMSTAESCTGGHIAHLITSVPGSSRYFKGSVVSYDNAVKENLLQVDPATIGRSGAVSEEVVRQMVNGVLPLIDTDLALAVSGIMGPDGGTPEKPVGTVWVAAGDRRKAITQKFQFRFDRQRNIELTSTFALNLLRKFILSEH
jgi:nicotinamide-nucleotide amidase